MIVRLIGTAARSVRASANELAGLPARQLASFMDAVDEVWLVEAFLDQPDSGDGAYAC